MEAGSDPVLRGQIMAWERVAAVGECCPKFTVAAGWCMLGS